MQEGGGSPVSSQLIYLSRLRPCVGDEASPDTSSSNKRRSLLLGTCCFEMCIRLATPEPLAGLAPRQHQDKHALS